MAQDKNTINICFETFNHLPLLLETFRLREIMDQLDSGQSFSATDVKQELGIAVAMLDKAATSAPLRDYRYGRKRKIPLPDFIRWGPEYESVYYEINNTRPIYSERAHRALQNPQVSC